MFLPFITLPDRSRIWVYQADKFIEPASRLIIDKELLTFTSAWAAHGQSLESSFDILENYFVVLAVNEEINNASGCSIDLSTQIFKTLEQLTGIDFFNRTLVPFEINGNVKQYKTHELREKFNVGELNEDSITFNILVDTIGSLRHSWKIPVSKSWIQRYIGPKAFDSVER